MTKLQRKAFYQELKALAVPIGLQNLLIALVGEVLGIIGIVSLSPIIVLQLLGFVYRVELDKQDYQDKRHAIKVSFTADMYSNIIALENEHKLLRRKKKNED